jgi:hypothetical protein
MKPPHLMTQAEKDALQYAIDWLRAFPCLSTAMPHVKAERVAHVAQLIGMLREGNRHVGD